MPKSGNDPVITPDLLLQAYASGVFPMADSARNPDIFWVDPDHRGVLPLDHFHISRSLKRKLRQGRFDIRLNLAFSDVVHACAQRKETWINQQIFGLYLALHDRGYAHALEVWQDDKLTGGVYGVALGGAFFGESMFSKSRDASKIALAYLTDRLRFGGFTLFDTQFLTPHLASLGGEEISRPAYQKALHAALEVKADFWKLPQPVQPSEVLHRNTQIS